MTTGTDCLKLKIEEAVERLMREHLLLCQTVVEAAVREGLRRATGRTPKGRRVRKAARPRAASLRRSRQEMAKLEERLYEAVRAQPGESMTVLAEVVGSTPRELNRPATSLRSAGRIRSAGQRQYTRYFPMAIDKDAIDKG